MPIAKTAEIGDIVKGEKSWNFGIKLQNPNSEIPDETWIIESRTDSSPIPTNLYIQDERILHEDYDPTRTSSYYIIEKLSLNGRTYARKLNADMSYDPFGEKIAFFQGSNSDKYLTHVKNLNIIGKKYISFLDSPPTNPKKELKNRFDFINET